MGLDPMRRAVVTLMPGRDVVRPPLESPANVSRSMRSRRTAQPPPDRTNRSQSLKPHIDDDRALDHARQPPSPAKSVNPINADSRNPRQSIVRKMLVL